MRPLPLLHEALLRHLCDQVDVFDLVDVGHPVALILCGQAAPPAVLGTLLVIDHASDAVHAASSLLKARPALVPPWSLPVAHAFMFTLSGASSLTVSGMSGGRHTGGIIHNNRHPEVEHTISIVDQPRAHFSYVLPELLRFMVDLLSIQPDSTTAMPCAE